MPASIDSSPPAPPASPVAPPTAACDNCGTILAGPFCHGCGQRDRDHLATVREFTGHIAEAALGYDSRLLRTLRALFAQPGLLTAEYVAGRRARYLSPLQLYLVAAALLFTTTTVRPMVTWEPAARRFHSGIATMSTHTPLDSATDARREARGISREVFAERFVASATKQLSSFLVLLVPLLALLVAVTFAGTGRPIAHHVLFALHWSAYFLLVLAAVQLVPPRLLHSAPAILLLFGTSAAYFVAAMRRGYAIGWLGAAMRGGPLFFVYLVVLILWLDVVARYTLGRI